MPQKITAQILEQGWGGIEKKNSPYRQNETLNCS